MNGEKVITAEAKVVLISIGLLSLVALQLPIEIAETYTAEGHLVENLSLAARRT